MMGYFIGFDIGSSSVKAGLIHQESGRAVAVVNEPEHEMDIQAIHPNWAEQDPEWWWKNVCRASQRILAENDISSDQIKGIGISYQMHGLVLLDKEGRSIRDAIIWCDSRAVTLGDDAFHQIGEEQCMTHMLNSPSNFTASKLAWVQQNEPEKYARIHKFMLPGDYIAYRFTGAMNTTLSGLSEGILWDFKNDRIAEKTLDHYNISKDVIADLVPTFGLQSRLHEKGAEASGLKKGTPILYRSGDQPNNAFSLNVLQPGEVASTGGTSGVLYAVTDTIEAHEGIKFNNFAHVNHSEEHIRIGKLLCINGSGSQYRWLKNILNPGPDAFEKMNRLAASVPVGAENLQIIPFGNGAERMFNNQEIGSHVCNINLNIHQNSHLCRAALEGIAFSFVYGMDILKKDHTQVNVIRTGNDNLYQSEVFAQTVATLIQKEIEIYNTTGAIGAARGAGVASGSFSEVGTVLSNNDFIKTHQPVTTNEPYVEAYHRWKQELKKHVKE